MQPVLSFETMEIPVGDFGIKSCLPDLTGQINVQNRTRFTLDEDDEIFEAYGQAAGAYPYQQRVGYTRGLKKSPVNVAVLENKYLKAVFLTDFGGRLWSLTDKISGRNLLYTNDVLRASNLAICGAWFSGGVEWNVGMIGHSPFTAEPLFVAQLKRDNGVPVLRMYEYERLRGVTFQMDFWLDEEDRFLNCRMRIDNTSSQVVPMYWWSNIAVPEYEGGRIAVPADNAFTHDHGVIRKTSIPLPDGEDVSYYCTLPMPVDYFYNIPKGQRKYIASFDAQGYGLLQISSDRLQGRKLFSWGHTTASRRWQEFLTERQGPYIEIQAGLGKTQYGCLPMPPHTAWEWVEQYGAIQVEPEILSLPFSDFSSIVTQKVAKVFEKARPEYQLASTKAMAKEYARQIRPASPFGMLADACREAAGERCLPKHLDFSAPDEGVARWINFLKTGSLSIPDVNDQPTEMFCEEVVFQKLLQHSKTDEGDNWFVWYHLGLIWLYKKDYERAVDALERSLEKEENAWAYHALACVNVTQCRAETAKEYILHGYEMQKQRYAYVLETFKILLDCKAFDEIVEIYHSIAKEMQDDGRLRMLYITALGRRGDCEAALALLEENGGLVVADTREGEDSLAALYEEIYTDVYKTRPPVIPKVFDFRMFV